MKRRDFFKWLPAIPLGIQALRSKEEPEVEVKPEPARRVHQRLGPQEGVATSCTAFTSTWPVNLWEK